MPPKGKDAKGAKGKGDKGGKGAAAPSTGTVTYKAPQPPDEPPMTSVTISPAVYDPRVHTPPVVYGAFWDFPGRRPQVRPGTAPLARMNGPSGDGGGGAAKGKDAGKKGKDAKGAKGKDAKAAKKKK